MKPIVIYSLSDHRNRKVFYIGATKNFKERVRQHLYPSKYYINLKTKSATADRNRLIKDIIDNGLSVIVNIIIRTTIKQAGKWERHYYRLYKKRGFRLLQSRYSFYKTHYCTF